MNYKFVLLITSVLFLNTYIASQVYTPKGSLVPDTQANPEQLTSYDISFIMQNMTTLYPNAVIIDNPTTTYNCHAYAWHMSEGGTPPVWMGLTTNPTPLYWNDGSYFETTERDNGLKVSYDNYPYNGSDIDNHSAITTTEEGVFISKWGVYPLVKHAKDYTPYSYSSLHYFKKNTATISGPTQICNQVTYTINNLPQGATVNWIGSRALSIVSGQGTNSVVCQKTMFALTGSTLILRAMITLPTGQTIELTKDIFVGTYPPAILLCPATYLPPFVPHVEYGYTNEDYFLFAHGENMSDIASDYLWKSYSPESSILGTGRYIEFSTSNPGEYKVSVQYNGECGWSTEIFRIIRFEDDLNVNLYPNPATDILTVELTSNQTKSSANLLTSTTNFEPYTIQLWNEYQGHVCTFEIIESKQQLSLRGLPSGMYIALIIKDGKTHQRKIVWKN